LINEPSRCTVAQYATVMRHGVEAIRAVDASRLILIDGLFGEATLPVLELTDLPNTIHSARGYAPFALSHYLAPWAGSPSQLPSWPMRISKDVEWNKQMLERWCIEPWQPVTRLHIPVFVGEWGCWNRTPHDVCLAWMRDFLNLWKAVGWGWALWCFRGSFGILDSGRSDVAYENWRGHKLDRKSSIGRCWNCYSPPETEARSYSDLSASSYNRLVLSPESQTSSKLRAGLRPSAPSR
jgi:endoglucanase